MWKKKTKTRHHQDAVALLLLIIGKKTETYLLIKEKEDRKVSLEYWLHYLFISYWVEKSKWEFAGLTTFYELTNKYRTKKFDSFCQAEI